MSVQVTAANFQKEVLEAEQTVLVDFWASWCGPCMRQGPILESFGAENPTVKICKINVDEEPALAQKFGIMSIPTLMVFKKGQLIKTEMGLHPKRLLAELVK